MGIKAGGVWNNAGNVGQTAGARKAIFLVTFPLGEKIQEAVYLRKFDRRVQDVVVERLCPGRLKTRDVALSTKSHVLMALNVWLISM